MNTLKKKKRDLHRMSNNRPSGYVADVLSHANKQNDEFYWISDKDYNDLCIKYRKSQDSRKTPCLHRGKAINKRLCQSCRGKVYITLFKCDLHNQCSIADRFIDVRDCLSCEDYKAGPTR